MCNPVEPPQNDFGVIRLSARCVVPYPKGALVELTDGRAAQAIRGNPDHPYLPVVRELLPEGARGEKIDLQAAKLGITGPLSAEKCSVVLTGRGENTLQTA